MLIQLKNGTTISMEISKYLELSDQDILDLEAYPGYVYDGAFTGSSIDNSSAFDLAMEEIEEENEYFGQELKDLNEIDSLEKLNDLDIDFSEEDY